MTTTPDTAATSAVALALYRTARALRTWSPPLSYAEWSVLSVVCDRGPITPGRVATLEGVRPPTVTRTVHALVDAGLVTRSGHHRNQRLVELRATPAGHAARAQGVPGAVADALASLDPADVDAVHRVAATLLERLHHRPASPAPAAAALAGAALAAGVAQ